MPACVRVDSTKLYGQSPCKYRVDVFIKARVSCVLDYSVVGLALIKYWILGQRALQKDNATENCPMLLYV